MLATLLVQYNPDGSLVYQNPYLNTQLVMGRQPFQYVEIDLDYCANTAGVAPCTASQTGDAKCFNTYATCNDTANFNLTTKTYRFCSPNGGKVPRGLDAIPCLRSISITPAEITAGKGLGLRAACAITMQDFPHSDMRIDPYVSERTYIPINRGTYFGKLKARNPFYNGRIMRVYSGYLEQDGLFNAANFEVRTYVIEQWDGIDTNGITKITAKDILKLASDDRAVAPKASIGKITLDMTTSTTSVNLTPTGIGSDYGSSGYVRIGSEVMAFTRSGDTLTLTRAQKGTTASTHQQGDTVQLCYQVVGQKTQNIVYDLLVNYAFVDPSFIDKSAWDAEQVGYLPRLYNTLVTTPTGVSKLLTELTEQVGFFLFWDEVNSLIKFQTIRPNSLSETVHELNTTKHLLADSVKMRDIVDDRVNEVWVYYGIIDSTKNLTEDSNYSNLYIASNVDDQSQVQNRDVRIKKLQSRWISDRSAAIELGSRYLERFAKAPIEADFALDAKDSNIALADFVQIDSPQHQDFSGSPLAILLQVVKRTEKQTGTTWAFTARQFAFGGATFVNRPIYIDGSYADELFDLNLKAAHDRRYDPASLTAGSIVEFIITSGIFISSSTTSTYALTNPNTWPSGVFVLLVIESGAVVAGRGGDGGRGGRAFYDDPRHDPMYWEYYGGNRANPSSGVHGKKGGNAILINHAITILNAGIISVGGGGGGASGGAIAGNDGGGGVFYGRTQSGSGGGGGWPFGTGGNVGQMNYDDTIFTDHTYSVGGYTYNQQVGNAGQTATKVIAVSNGGNPRINSGSAYFFAETHTAGDGGCPVLATLATNGGDSQAAGDIGYIYAGDGGNAGANGDYAINGNSHITWLNTGLIYGNIV